MPRGDALIADAPSTRHTPAPTWGRTSVPPDARRCVDRRRTEQVAHPGTHVGADLGLTTRERVQVADRRIPDLKNKISVGGDVRGQACGRRQEGCELRPSVPLQSTLAGHRPTAVHQAGSCSAKPHILCDLDEHRGVDGRRRCHETMRRSQAHRARGTPRHPRGRGAWGPTRREAKHTRGSWTDRRPSGRFVFCEPRIVCDLDEHRGIDGCQ